MNEWIKCEDRMPEENKTVLTYDGDSVGEGFCGRYYYPKENRTELKMFKWPRCSGSDYYPIEINATHWMPLPAPPAK
jgi:hypothetical protein